MRIKPLRDRIVAEVLEKPGEPFLVVDRKGKKITGYSGVRLKVLAVGKDVLDIKEGDTVWVATASLANNTAEKKLGDKTVKLFHESDVTAVEEE